MKLSSFFILTVFVLTSACNQLEEQSVSDADKIIYDVFFRGKLAGTYEKWSTGANSFAYQYNYNDRGRGPDNLEQITLNEQHFITAQSISGVNYRKAKVDETFRSDQNTASWKNSMEEKEGDFNGSMLYFRHSGSPAIYEILAQLLLKADDNKVPLYPEGQAELTKKTPLKLSNGTTLDLLMVKGLGMNPSYIWMQGDQMIAQIAGNLHIIKKDWSSLRQEMKTLQDDIEDANLIEMAKQLSHEIDKVVIQNVNVFRTDGTILPKQDVWIAGQKISSINPTNQRPVPENITSIDGTGKTLMPGMFDMHTHNTKFRGLLHLAGGITSVRDLANNKQLKDLAAQFDQNEILGPRIVYFCGIIDGPGEFANQRNVVQDLEEGLAEIEDYARLGYEQIKIYSSIKPEWVLPLTEKAHELGMRVSGHIPAYMTATQAINQGFNEIQHINMLFLNFLSDTIDTRTPLRHTMPAKHGADLELNSKEYLDFVSLLKTKDILVDPTIAIFENMYISQKGEPSPTYNPIIKRLPLMDQRGYYSGGLQKEGPEIARYQASFEKMLDVIADLYRRDIDIVPGTDGLPGFLYHRELELYERAGIPAAEVLQLATIKSAEITGVADAFGSIEVGKQADLILIDGNPLEDISDIRKVEWTMKGAHLYYAEELYEAMGIQHFK